MLESTTPASNLQPLNASEPIEVTLFGITNEVKAVQLRNAFALMTDSVSGKIIPVNFEHPLNADTPTETNAFGNVTLVSPVQP